VLVATDGSDSAHRAVDYAADLAKRESGELIIVNVIGGMVCPTTSSPSLRRPTRRG